MVKNVIKRLKSLSFRMIEKHYNNRRIDRKIYRYWNDSIKNINYSNYWEKVSFQILNASIKENGNKFFLNRYVIDHIASENSKLGYHILAMLRKHKDGIKLLNLIQTPPWGAPYLLSKYPYLSPTTTSHIANIVAILDMLQIEITKLRSFVEFGGGYGGLARCLLTLSQNINIYIVDIEEMHRVQQNYLNNTLTKKYSIDYYKNVNDINENNIDIFNASFSFSELPLDKRENIIKFIQRKCNAFFIIYQEKFNDIDNKKYMENLKNNFKDNNWFVKIENYKWYLSKDCHIIYGKKN